MQQDPIIGAAFNNTDTPAPAELVDLDSRQQGVSQTWGLQIKVALSATEYFVGDFRVNCFNDLFGRVVGRGGMAAFGAYFQRVSPANAQDAPGAVPPHTRGAPGGPCA